MISTVPNVYEQAKLAAKLAVEEQMMTWGITPDQRSLWDHLSGNARSTVNTRLEVNRLGGPDTLPEIIKRPAVSVKDLTPAVIWAMDDAFTRFRPDEEKIEAAFRSSVPASPKSATEWATAMTASLTRTGAEVAEHILHPQVTKEKIFR